MFEIRNNRLTEIDLTILELITENRITGKTIERYFNISTRERFHSIERLRDAGYPILGDKSHYNPGYYMATSQEQIEQWYSLKEREYGKLTRQREQMLKRVNDSKDLEAI